MVKSLHVPERTCIVTGETGGKHELLRFVVGPEDRIVPDVAGKLPGRGIWVSCRRSALAQAVAKNAFRRAARKPVGADAALVEQVGELLAARALQSLALARKSGQAVAGFEKVREALEADQAVMLIHAADASVDGIRKLLIDKAVPAHYMDRDKLAAIMGRDNLAHIAVLKGPAAGQALINWRRFAGFYEQTSV